MNWAAIEFSPLLPWPVLAAAAVASVVVAALLLVVRARGGGFRIAAIAILLLALLNPSVVQEEREPQKDVAVLLVDETPSIGLGGRRQQVADAAAKIEARLAELSRTLETRVVRVRHATIADGAEGSKLIEPLTRALQDVPKGRVAGAILLTDGQVHDLPGEAAQASLPAPLHVLVAGRRDEADRRLVVPNAPSYGIVGKDIDITIRIEDHGPLPARDTAQLTIRRDGKALNIRSVPVGREHKLSFPLKHGGPTVFELSVEAAEREMSLANNRAVVSVNGVRDRLRVLLVSGEPHAGERTWRNLLKSDASVDLVHFTILRPPEKQDGTPIQELSLISFPTRELFEVKLDEFDLVIFDRYRRRGVLPPVYLQNIVDYVEKGGALLTAAGPTFASPFSVYRTPLRKVLPGEPTGGMIARGFRPSVTDPGNRHPVTAGLAPRPAGKPGDTPTWGRWFRQVEVAAKRGHTLMRGIDELPLLILDRVGEGRVAQLNSDHIWLWARGFEGGGPQAELLRRLAHWLMKEPELEEDALRAVVREGRIEVERRSIETDTPTVEITGPDGAKRSLKLAETTPGRYAGNLPVTEAGLYMVSDGEHTAMAAAGALNPLELADMRATGERLAPLAKATGGGVFWLADGLPDIRRLPPRRTRAGRNWLGLTANGDYLVTGARRFPALPALLVLLLALGAMALAWRREGG
jgi:hypothetical protein